MTQPTPQSQTLSRDMLRLHVKAMLGILITRQRSLEIELAQVVTLARMMDLPWSEIGGMLGVSKQAAAKRYGALTTKDLFAGSDKALADYPAVRELIEQQAEHERLVTLPDA
jgi:hypothetical protein